MQNYYNYKKYAILYVDDEEKSLKYFSRTFGNHFRILTAQNALEGYQVLEAHKDEVGILMTDQRMPGEKGVQLLAKARQLRPRILRILATAYSDLEAAIQAVNSGAIYQYITKPWDPPSLETILRRGLEFFIVQSERDALMREKITALHNVMITDRVISLGVLAAGLGHYVRNSLVAVRTFLDLAPGKLEQELVRVDDLRNPTFWKDFYQQVQNQVKRITEMLTDLGEMKDKQAPFFQDQIQLRPLIEEVLGKMQARIASQQITVDNQIPENLPDLHVDRPKIRRLFELLLEDELTTLPPGSRIHLRASAPAPAPDAEPEIQLEVQDNGPGMPAERVRAVFDPFFVRNNDPQQFGINLMACYFIVHHHGGRIDVQSQEGQGTSFVLRLPLQPPGRQEFNEQDFLAKVLMNDSLWEKLLTGL